MENKKLLDCLLVIPLPNHFHYTFKVIFKGNLFLIISNVLYGFESKFTFGKHLKYFC